MNNLDDLIGMYDDAPATEPKKETTNNNTNYNNNNQYNKSDNKKKNYWDSTDVKRKKVDTSKFDPKKPFKYAMSYQPIDGKLPDEAEKRMLQIAEFLNNNGFVFNWNGDATRSLYQNLLGIEDFKYNTYLPWAKFNEDAKNVILKYPSNEAYEVAFEYNKNIGNLKNGTRAIISRDVNTLLGADLTDPVKFLIVYSPDGAESIEKIDFKKNSWITFVIRVAEAANIPVFNIGKDDAVKRLNEYLKILKGASNGETEN